MRVVVCVCIFVGTLVAGNPQRFWENRFGIVRLHSTRADVDRLYGVCGDSLRCIFQTTKEQLNVAYATAPCAGLVDGWNVPKDTVLSFTVRPYVPIRFAEIALDLNGFVERHSSGEPGITYYTSVGQNCIFCARWSRILCNLFPAEQRKWKAMRRIPAV